VCDAGPLIHLDELRSLDLLNVFQQVLVPEAVWNEVKRHRPCALHRRGVTLTQITEIPQLGEFLASVMENVSLDPGEEHALRLMQKFPNAIFLTDDDSARDVATALQYAVHGTLWILLQAVETKRRPQGQILRVLRTLRRRTTLHVSQQLLNEVISRVREGLHD
jgi:predicted nucleic acid-binding protein